MRSSAVMVPRAARPVSCEESHECKGSHHAVTGEFRHAANHCLTRARHRFLWRRNVSLGETLLNGSCVLKFVPATSTLALDDMCFSLSDKKSEI